MIHRFASLKSQAQIELGRLRMIYRFFAAPEKLHALSARQSLPVVDGRCVYGEEPLDDFDVLSDVPEALQNIGDINIVMKGTSLDRDKLNDLTGDLALVNWSAPHTHPNGKVWYVTSDQNNLSQMMANNLFPIIFVLTNPLDAEGAVATSHQIRDEVSNCENDPRVSIVRLAYKGYVPLLHLGSGLGAVVGIGKIAKRINIFGWDFYQPKPLSMKSTFGALLALMNFAGDRSRPGLIECALFDWLYAYRLENHPKFSIQGHLNGLARFPKITASLVAVFYRDAQSTVSTS